MAMTLIKRKTRITAKRVAEIIGCSEKTIYNGGAGTDGLTRIRNGRRQVRFILEEAIALVSARNDKHSKSTLENTNEPLAKYVSRVPCQAHPTQSTCLKLFKDHTVLLNWGNRK